MVKYECFRCGYTSTHKPNFINHLKRKNICPAKNDENFDRKYAKIL